MFIGTTSRGRRTTHHTFFHSNVEKLEAAAEIEEKARRRGIIVDEDTLFDFYDSRLPATVTTGRHFDSWWKKERQANPHLLDFDPESLLGADAESVTEAPSPTSGARVRSTMTWSTASKTGHPQDGVTTWCPSPCWRHGREGSTGWYQYAREMLNELIRTLPKELRQDRRPAPDYAAGPCPDSSL